MLIDGATASAIQYSFIDYLVINLREIEKN